MMILQIPSQFPPFEMLNPAVWRPVIEVQIVKDRLARMAPGKEDEVREDESAAGG